MIVERFLSKIREPYLKDIGAYILQNDLTLKDMAKELEWTENELKRRINKILRKYKCNTMQEFRTEYIHFLEDFIDNERYLERVERLEKTLEGIRDMVNVQ